MKIAGIVLVAALAYFLFVARIAVKPSCHPCERGEWDSIAHAALTGKEILGPYFLHPLFQK